MPRTDDAYLAMAKEYIATVTAPGTPWTGPTTGPTAQGKKLIVYVSSDQRNGGPQGAGDGAQEAAKVIGWDFRILDGQGSVQGRTTALNQAIALKPDGIILGNVDTLEQAPVIQKAAALGIKMVGWHVAPRRRSGQGSRRSSPTSPPTLVKSPKRRRSMPLSTPTAPRASFCSRTASRRSPRSRPTPRPR